MDPSAHPRPSPWVWEESWVQNSWSAPPPSHQTRWTLRTTGDAWRNHTWSLGTGECAGPGAPSAAHRGLVQKALPSPHPLPRLHCLGPPSLVQGLSPEAKAPRGRWSICIKVGARRGRPWTEMSGQAWVSSGVFHGFLTCSGQLLFSFVLCLRLFYYCKEGHLPPTLSS